MKKWKRVCTSPSISSSAIFKSVAGFILAFLLFACTSIPEPGQNHVRYAQQHGLDTSLADLQEGRRLMVNKCSGCHSVPRVLNKRHTPETWPIILDSMRIQAKLTPHQDTLIRTFIMVASGERRDSLAALKASK